MKNRLPLTLIFLTVFIDLLGFGILIPILPTFAKIELGIDETAIGIAIAIYSLTQFFFNPIFGNLSDKYGRKPVIVVSLLLNAAGYVVFAYTHSFLMLIISRVIAGIGGSSIGVAQAYIADVTTKENRAKGMGLIGAAFGLGFVFGPLMGGILSHYSYQITGFTSAGFSFLAFALTLMFLPESLDKSTIDQTAKRTLFNIHAFKNVLNNKNLFLTIGLFFLVTFSVANIYGTFALLGQEIYHFNNMQIGYIYTIIGLTSALIQGWLMNKATKYFTDKQFIVWGSLLMAISLAIMPFGQNFLGLSIIIIVFSLGTGSLQPTILSLISKVTPESEQGITLGLNQSISAFARVLGPIWGGFAFEFFGYATPFLTGAFFTILIFIFSAFYLSKHFDFAKFSRH